MAWQYSPFLLPLLLASGVSLAVAGVAWRFRESTGAGWLVVLMLATGWWSLTYLVGLATTDPALKALVYQLMYPAIGVVPVAWLVFAVEYTGRFRSLRPPEVAGLFSVPAVLVGLMWTGVFDGLIWTSTELVTRGSLVVLATTKGVGFWVLAGYTYLLLAIGTGLVLQMVARSSDLYRGQAVALVVAALIPWAGNALYLSGLTGVWDPTNLGFALGGLVLMAAVFRRQLLQVVPVAREVARDELIESMAEPVIVVDDKGHVVDLNPTAVPLVDRSGETAVGARLDEMVPAVARRVDPSAEARDRAEVTMTDGGEDRQYEVQMVPLRRGEGTVTGQLLTMRDVTTRHERERRLRRQRQRLEVLTRVLRHDIRNGMNVILGHLDRVATENPEETLDAVEAIRQKSKEIAGLSRSAQRFEAAISGDQIDRAVVDLVDVIESIVDGVETDYPAAQVHTDLPTTATVLGTALTGFAIRNLIENAIEHNDQSTPRVTVSLSATAPVRLRIADDGPGLPEQERSVLEEGHETALEHSSGLGLWLATWVIRSTGGDIEIAPNDPRGTVIDLQFPPADWDTDPSFPG